MSKEYLSDAELVDLYDAARDKAKCIDSVAVRCRTTRAAVRERLVRLGCIEEAAAKRRGRPKKQAAAADAKKVPETDAKEDTAMEQVTDPQAAAAADLPEPPTVSPACCQPAKPVDVWSEWPEASTAPVEQISESAAEAAPEPLLTVAEFLALCTELLTPAAVRASLYINGAPVREIAQIVIKARGGALCVDIVTEAEA